MILTVIISIFSSLCLLTVSNSIKRFADAGKCIHWQRFFPFDASGGNNGTWEHSSQKFFAEQYLQKILQENLEPLRQV